MDSAPVANGGQRSLHLIDVSGFIFRAFHALPPLNRADGTPVNAVLGYCNMLLRILESSKADAIAAIFDVSRVTFRNSLYADYKANRTETPPELIPQFALIREATRAFGLPTIELDNYEADDLIASYAAAVAPDHQVIILSTDKDLMQLVDDRVTLYDPVKYRSIGKQEVFEKFGVTPDKVIEVQALMGDSSDNVPGVRGIGEKTAAKLITEYGSVENLLASLDQMKPSKIRDSLIEQGDLARLSKVLVTLKNDCPLPVPIDQLKLRRPDPEVLRDFLAAQGFGSLLKKLHLGAITTTASPESVQNKNQMVESAVIAAPTPPLECDYQTIQEWEQLDHWLNLIAEAGIVAFDTETTGLNTMQAELVGISLAVAAGSGCYIPLAHGSVSKGGLDFDGKEQPKQLARDQVLQRLAPMLSDAAVLKIGHNIKYDMNIMANYGIAISPIDDTMLLSSVLEGGKHGHGMDDLALLFLNHRCTSYDQVTGTGKSRISFAEVEIPTATQYAAEDADITLRLWQNLKPRLLREKQVALYEQMERPLIAVISAMERRGILVDRGQLESLSRDFGERLLVLEREIHGLAGREFNVGSPAQLGVILFEEQGLPGGKKSSKSGAYSTDAAVLESLAESGNQLAASVVKWREIAKLKSTYSEALVKQIDPKTGRVHTNYALAATTTGRLSSNDPNLQNIPIRTPEGRKIRKAFIAAPGHKLLSLDYSQIELRLLAEIADIPALKSAFREGRDIHAQTASEIFELPLERVDKDLRRRAKAINFGIVYGISAFGLAAQLDIAQGEAKRYIERYFARYPGIRAYMDRAKESAQRDGFVTTLFGRRCHIQGAGTKGPARGFADRQAINAPIQGSAADVIKKAMVRMPAALAAAGLRESRMLLQVHDELLFEVPIDAVEATASVAKSVMEGVVALSIPLTVEFGSADNWAEAH
ncbi:MAG: DNA polymerase I [Candidatus Pacebacteria bacterium]|nr:DNA polymerase I [Candidatus Paceibacterota bacterium]